MCCEVVEELDDFLDVLDVAEDFSEAMVLRETKVVFSTVIPSYKNVPTIFCIKLMSTESNLGASSVGSEY